MAEVYKSTSWPSGGCVRTEIDMVWRARVAVHRTRAWWSCQTQVAKRAGTFNDFVVRFCFTDRHGWDQDGWHFCEIISPFWWRTSVAKLTRSRWRLWYPLYGCSLNLKVLNQNSSFGKRSLVARDLLVESSFRSSRLNNFLKFSKMFKIKLIFLSPKQKLANCWCQLKENNLEIAYHFDLLAFCSPQRLSKEGPFYNLWST